MQQHLSYANGHPTQHNDDVNYDDGMGEIACMKMLSSIFVRKQRINFTMDVH